METAAAGAQQTAGLRASRLCRQPAQPRGPHHPGDEHGPALHEGAREPDPRPPGAQQLLRRQHQHRARRLRVVRRAGAVLGSDEQLLREVRSTLSLLLLLTSTLFNVLFCLFFSFQEQHQLPDGIVVAQPGGPIRG